MTLPFRYGTGNVTLAQAEGFYNAPAAQEVVRTVIQLSGAIAILVLGWIFALIASSVVHGILKRTEVDNRIAAWITGQPDRAKALAVEKWAATIVFWVVMIFALVAFFNALELDVVSEPLKEFLREISIYAPRVLSAAILCGVAWVLATVVKLTLTQGMQRFSLDDRLAEQLGSEEGQGAIPLAIPLNETLGNVLYWLIFLFFLPIILDTLQLQGTLQPVQNLIDQLLSALPQIFKAVLIALIGWFVARLVRTIVTSFLRSVSADRLGTQFGLSDGEEGVSLSTLAGMVLYSLILIFTTISALEALQIEAISGPAIAMLNQILTAIPYLLQAGLILLVAYVIARFVTDLVTHLLTGLGFNDVLNWIGLQGSVLGTGTDATAAETPASSPAKTPSEIVGIVVGVGIVLFGAVAAVDALQFEQLSEIVAALIEIGGKIIYGLVVLAIGLYLANLAFRLVSMPGTKQSKLLAQAARISIIILVTAMGIEQMGIATNIINLAFGLLTGAIAVAIAIAFGWGGKDIAAEQLKKWIDSWME